MWIFYISQKVWNCPPVFWEPLQYATSSICLILSLWLHKKVLRNFSSSPLSVLLGWLLINSIILWIPIVKIHGTWLKGSVWLPSSPCGITLLPLVWLPPLTKPVCSGHSPPWQKESALYQVRACSNHTGTLAALLMGIILWQLFFSCRISPT
jgi:hypothetical protein